MIVSGAQQSDSAIHIHVSILPQTPLLSRLDSGLVIYERNQENSWPAHTNTHTHTTHTHKTVLAFILKCDLIIAVRKKKKSQF